MGKYKYLSFFSGALGLDLGLEKAGLECLSTNEIEKPFCDTITLNKPKLKVYNNDIRSLTAENLKKDLKLKSNELFLIAGGPPCQSFSSAGKMKGLDDQRGNVSISYVEMITKLKPKYFVLENVRGLLTAEITSITPAIEPYRKHVHLNRKGGVLYLIIKILEDSGYFVNFDLYNTAFFGVPQKRERLVIIGSLDAQVPLIPATHSKKPKDGLLPFVTFQDACQNIQEHHHINFDAHRYEFLEKIPEGGNWKSLDKEDQIRAMGNSYLSGGGKSGFYRRLSRTEPTPTLTTSPRMPATMLCHPTELRPISIEEYSRIQTFPENFKFNGNITEVYRQIGNAVPVEFGYAIGRHILEFENNKNYKPKYLKTTKYKNTRYDDFMIDFVKDL
jgi:DNA (cytosine-5)-methyltransferase 1